MGRPANAASLLHDSCNWRPNPLEDKHLVRHSALFRKTDRNDLHSAHMLRTLIALVTDRGFLVPSLVVCMQLVKQLITTDADLCMFLIDIDDTTVKQLRMPSRHTEFNLSRWHRNPLCRLSRCIFKTTTYPWLLWHG